MRCLRTSFYDTPGPASITTVTRDCDLRDTLESAALGLQDAACKEGALALTEVFDMDGDVSIEQATDEGMRRLGERAEEELNQVILYYWAVLKWKLLKRDGTLIMDKPAPLTRDEIIVVLEQLAHHPEYREFRIISTDQTGALVELANGKIEEARD